MVAKQLQTLLDQWNSLEQRNVEGSMVSALFAQRTRITSYLRTQSLSVLTSEMGSVATMHDVNVLLGCNPKGAIYDLVWGRRIGLIGALSLAPRSYGNLSTPDTGQ